MKQRRVIINFFCGKLTDICSDTVGFFKKEARVGQHQYFEMGFWLLFHNVEVNKSKALYNCRHVQPRMLYITNM